MRHVTHSVSFVCLRTLSAALATTLLLGACADDSSTARVVGPDTPTLDRNDREGARGVFHRYVAIGTSISMGWASDGVISASQQQAWPLQIARRANRTMSAPSVAFPGCRSPFAVPLASFRRVSLESVAIPAANLSCAPNEAGVTLPAANTAINNARAFDARFTTPENTRDLGNRQLYQRVLPPNTTQVQAMERQNPKFVSVELGANEVLGAASGVVIPGATVVPAQFFAPDYDAILDRVAATVNTGAVLVGLIDDAATFPAFRRGSEIWSNRGEFRVAFNVEIQADCDNSPNLITVPFRIPAIVAAGVTARNAGQGPVPFSCAAGAPNVSDFVLTPAEVTQLNVIIAGIDAHIAGQATERGWAHFRLDALYGMPGLKGTFSVVQLMTSAQPYGPYMSLDGFHPSALGQRVLADAAAAAINQRYKLGITTGVSALIATR